MRQALFRLLAAPVILFGLFTPVLAEPVKGNAEAGAKTFQKACSACHSITEGGRHRVGPNLYGIAGKPAAAHKDYPYTEAFKRSNVVWDDKALNSFLAGPTAFIPGTKMDWIIEQPQDIADVIAYLKQNAP
jgi:cytochrome c